MTPTEEAEALSEYFEVTLPKKEAEKLKKAGDLELKDFNKRGHVRVNYKQYIALIKEGV